ncbi:hypothetical protein pb186bvf_003683 [Paramecium bursaria]
MLQKQEKKLLVIKLMFVINLVFLILKLMFPQLEDRILLINQVEVRLYEKGFFSDSEVGLASFSFDSLQERSVCDGVVVIKSKKGDIQLCYQLGIREPLNKFSTHQIQFLRIVNKYPPFNVQEEVKEYLEKNMVALPSYEEYKKQQQILEQQQQLEKQKEEEALKLQQQEEENLKKQQEEMQKQAGQLIVLNHMPDSPEIAIIKQYIDTKPQIVPGLELQDLIYPENPVKFPVFNFMDQYTDFLRLKGVELRQEPSLRPQYKFVNQMWESYLRQKTVILLNNIRYLVQKLIMRSMNEFEDYLQWTGINRMGEIYRFQIQYTKIGSK